MNIQRIMRLGMMMVVGLALIFSTAPQNAAAQNKQLSPGLDYLLADGLEEELYNPCDGLEGPGSASCVPSVEAQFLSIPENGGKPSAFQYYQGGGGFDFIGQDPTTSTHYQGVARINGTNTFIFNRNGNPLIGTDYPGELHVVEMGPVGMFPGEPLGQTCASTPGGNKCEPRSGSRIVDTLRLVNDLDNNWHTYNTIDFPGGRNQRFPYPHTGWKHPGSGQQAGKYLFIPMEKTCDSTDIQTACGGNSVARGGILIVDVYYPEGPMIVGEITKLSNGDDLPMIGTLAVTQVSGDTYLLAGFGGKYKQSEAIIFYELKTPEPGNLEGTSLFLTRIGAWDASELLPEKNDKKWRCGWDCALVTVNWQSMNFLRQTDDTLYFIVGDNDTELPAPDGRDFLRLFKVERSGSKFTLTYISERRLNLGTPMKLGDLNAVGGVSVSPTGRLSFYTAPYDNQGWEFPSPCDDKNTQLCKSLQFGEFTSTIDLAPEIASLESYPPWGSEEGTTPHYVNVTFLDPGQDVHDVTIDWGDGSSPWPLKTLPGEMFISPGYTYKDSGEYTVKVTICDAGGKCTSKSTIATVLNVAPILTLPGNQFTTNPPGTTASFDLGYFDDPAGGPTEPWLDGIWSVKVDWGDGSTPETFDLDYPGGLNEKVVVTKQADGSETRSVVPTNQHVYAKAGIYTVTVSVTDKDGGVGSDNFTIRVNGAAVVDQPVFTPASSKENEQVTASVTFSDDGDDRPYVCTVYYGDGSATLPGTISGDTCQAPAHTYLDDGLFTVIFTITDKNGAPGVNFKDFLVENVKPVLTVSEFLYVDQDRVSTFDLGSFTDPGSLDGPWSVEVDWGDGSGTKSFQYMDAPGDIKAQTAYPNRGIHTITVSVLDKDGGRVEEKVLVQVGLPQLTVEGTGDGRGTLTSVQPVGAITCSIDTGTESGTCTNLSNRGTVFSISALAAEEDHVFSGWTGCDSVSGSRNEICEITLDTDMTVSADFSFEPALDEPVQPNAETPEPPKTPISADLRLTQTVNKATPALGDSLAFMLTLTNDGPDLASGVTVTVPLPSGLAGATVTALDGTSYAAGVWEVPALKAGGSVKLTIEGTANAETIISTTEVATSDLDDPDSTPGNGEAAEDDYASLAVVVLHEDPGIADLELTQTVDNPTPTIGDRVTFVLKLTNVGPSTATNVVVFSTEIIGFVPDAFTPSGSTTYNSVKSEWTIDSLESEKNITLTITGLVDGSDEVATNTAVVLESDLPDPDSTPGLDEVLDEFGNPQPGIVEEPYEDDYSTLTLEIVEISLEGAASGTGDFSLLPLLVLVGIGLALLAGNYLYQRRQGAK